MTTAFHESHPATNGTDSGEEGWLLESYLRGNEAPSSGEPPAAPTSTPRSSGFHPAEPTEPRDLGIREADVTDIALRCLLQRNVQTGRQLASQLALLPRMFNAFLERMRQEKLVAVRRSSGGVDYEYELTERGLEAARRAREATSYFGAVPVPVHQYVASLERQTISRSGVTRARLDKALVGLAFDERTVRRIGQALVGGRSLLIAGAPGNGKTSVARRMASVYPGGVWIPRAISFEGRIARLYDPLVHEEATPPQAGGYDQRWVYVKRPSVVVGGELTLESFEFGVDPSTGLLDPPIQLKANGGVLVVDDFGRQRVSTEEILNRLIVPLESRFDMLVLPSGHAFRVPFEQIVVFSTNLEPSDLVDEAFMRRIPYKVRVQDPTVEQFASVFGSVARDLGLSFDGTSLDHLITRHFQRAGRPMRFCHPRDLLSLVRDECLFEERGPVVTKEALDEAVLNYFAE